MQKVSVLRYPPGPRTIAPLGMLRRFRRAPVETLMDLTRTYGDYVRFRVGPDYLYLVSDPAAIQDILVTDNANFIKSRAVRFIKRVLGEGLLTSEGDFHLRQRRMVQPAFHRQRMVGYAAVMANHAARTAARWQEAVAQQGQPRAVDMSVEMARLALAIVGKTLFDADVTDDASEISQAVNTALELFDRFSNPLTPLLERLPLPSNRHFADAMQRLDATVMGMVEQRRASGEDRGDLLSMLLSARDEGDQTQPPVPSAQRGGMTDRQVRDEAMTLFLAGHETTANLLTWTWYLLAQNPKAETRLHRELDEVLAGRLPAFDDLSRLPYTRMVLSESMRLFPPAYVIGREALTAYQLGPYAAPAGATVLMSQFVVHHDPRWYPEPDHFEPERWLPTAQAARPRFAYFPFGGGPRLCIGEQFAWTEASLVLATLAQRWQPRLLPGHPVALRPLITLRPRYGMKMVLEPRRPQMEGSS